MGLEEFEEVAPEVISRDRYPPKDDGHYGPSEVSGCPLRVYLDRKVETEDVMNSWMFAGKAVHYYLQESGIMDEALEDAGFHPALTEYEKTGTLKVDDDLYLHGSADIVAGEPSDTPGEGPEKAILDIKYSSIPIESGHPRLAVYLAQAHLYSEIFDADKYGILLINSKSRELEEDIVLVEGVHSQNLVDTVFEKVRNIHSALEATGYFEGLTFTVEEVEMFSPQTWENIVTEHFNIDNIPAYDGECDYCDHNDYCPVANDSIGGIADLVNRTS
jgi:hypothetical protein